MAPASSLQPPDEIGALARTRTGMTFRSTDFKSVDSDLTPNKSLLFQSFTDFARVQAVYNLQVIMRFLHSGFASPSRSCCLGVSFMISASSPVFAGWSK